YWVLRFRDGRKWGFTYNIPRLIWYEDNNNNRVTVERIGAGYGFVGKVTGPTGRYLKFDYVGDTVSQVSDNMGRTVSYAYDGVDPYRLISVTDAEGEISNYSWDPIINRIVQIEDSNMVATLLNTYDMDGRVESQTLADTSTFLFSYSTDI